MNSGGQSRRVLIAIIAAVVVAGAFAYVLTLSHGTAAPPVSTGNTATGADTPVVTAIASIAQGTEITALDVQVTKVPASVVPAGDKYNTVAQVTGQYAIVAIPSGTIISTSNIASTAVTVSSNDTVFPAPGTVAVAISVSKSQDLGYYIQQGQYINMIVLTNDSNGPAIEYGFQNIEVLKVGSLDETLAAKAAAAAATPTPTALGATPGSGSGSNAIVVTPSIVVVEMTPIQAEAYEYLVTQDPNAIVTFVLAGSGTMSGGKLSGSGVVDSTNINQVLASS